MRPYRCKRCGGREHRTERDGHRRCVPCRREWSRDNAQRYYQKNRIKILERRKAWREKNRRRELGRTTAYHLENPWIKEEHLARRKEKVRLGGVTRDELGDIVRRDGGRCVYCGVVVRTRCVASDPRGFDHLLHLLGDGEHEAWNLAVCCVDCNSAKGSTPFWEYVERAGIGGDLSWVSDRVKKFSS